MALTLDLQHIPDTKYLCEGLCSVPAICGAASLLHCGACVSEHWVGDAKKKQTLPFCPCAFEYPSGDHPTAGDLHGCFEEDGLLLMPCLSLLPQGPWQIDNLPPSVF